MNLFVFGSSLLSSYWNGAATYYRGIYSALRKLGHNVTFAEPDAFERQRHLDPGDYSYARSIVYQPGKDLDAMVKLASQADLVIKHSGIGVDDAVLEHRILECQPQAAVIFWDVDAPATIARLEKDRTDPLLAAIPRYDAVFTYGGGPRIKAEYLKHGARRVEIIYNALDPSTHYPVSPALHFACDLVLVANRLPDRERRVDELFLRAAQLAPGCSFLLGGEGWGDKVLPPNVRRLGHVPTGDHNVVNSSARMALNINRSSMATFGFSPPTRVFEAAGSATCLLCDAWPGVEEFFKPDEEILIVHSAEDIAEMLAMHDAHAAKKIGMRMRNRALRDHTYETRAASAGSILEELLREHRLSEAFVR